VSEKAVIEGKVIIEDGVRVMENAVIKGPVYIGKNSIIGNNTLVRGHSHVGAECTVGFGTEIKGSYLGEGCQTHMNFIGDSVLGERCSFGAGTVTANWRFDEKPVWVKIQGSLVDTGRAKLGAIIGSRTKTGVNVSIMPGMKIAAGARIPPGQVVVKDVEG
ncbi:MAG: hypothetical protein PHE50_05075, partial [Dehalococcoidales bacterium]|nr:hypothetical protein [Dehalococcoidales bacterium]